MANPNIVNVTAIYGNTAAAALATTNAAIVTNASGSGKIYKINSLYISNSQGTNAADVTIEHVAGATRTPLASTISVAADSTLVLITKDTALYLMENQTLNGVANLVTHLNYLCSWDEINA